MLVDTADNASTLYQVSRDESDFFYHMAEWYDVDGDGAARRRGAAAA